MENGWMDWKVDVESGWMWKVDVESGKWIVDSGKWKVARFRISHKQEEKKVKTKKNKQTNDITQKILQIICII